MAYLIFILDNNLMQVKNSVCRFCEYPLDTRSGK